MTRKLLYLATLLAIIEAQDSSFPLESISVEGTAIPKETVLAISGFHLGAPVDKAAIEAGCMKLQASGVFQSINYHYAQGPKHGYALTLTLADQSALSDAVIDIPGVVEDEVWRWLMVQYPGFNHKVPSAAQDFLARQIEQHLAASLNGQHIVVRLESAIGPQPGLTLSFQPEMLPHVGAMIFKGQNELTSAELVSILQKVNAGDAYTDRRFRQFVEFNLRPAYEEHGMYRVRFPAIAAQRVSGSAVDVTTTVDEGPKFTLGEVQISGDGLPTDAMLAAAKFKKGQIANWTETQRGIWELEKPVKRLGYMSASAKPERILNDDRHVLDIRISVVKGPLYQLGRVSFTGLAPDLEARARKIWGPQPGAPYDYEYPNDFLRALSKSSDLRQFKKFSAKSQAGAGEHVMDVTLII